ncbi:MAG: thioredoxin family protein [Bryobacteraceae bacterium]|nr:thioredoxin family protein [Bryobacteraceae bacterium]
MIRTAIVGLLLAMAAAAQSPSELKYDAKADPKADFQAALARASKDGRNVLMDVGGEWCGWCHRMDRFITEHEELSALLAKNYVLVKVNFSDENKNEPFLKQFPKIDGYPHIFVFDASGKLLISKSTGDLEEGKSYNLGRFVEFLKQYAPGK